MQRWRGLDAVPSGWGRCVVTIGVFDGVHRGHQVIIGRAVERARKAGLPSVLLTFDPHPSEVVRPGSHPAVLSAPRHKAELVERLGVDVFCVVPFTLEFSRLSPEEFVHEVLVASLHTAVVVVGENFRFGSRAAGDVPLLQQLGRRFGFSAEGVPLLADRDDPDATTLSSTFVRACVDAGDVATAAAALGRPHRVEGVVVRGDRRGRELGYPTANIAPGPYAAVPADGVYAAWLVRGTGERTERLPAAVSIGTNPTFAGRERRVEAFVMGAEADDPVPSPDLYGEHVGLDVVARLRATERYSDAEALVAQIARDVEDARAALRGT